MNQHTLLSLNYSSSMQDYYQKLAHLPGFVLLESSDRPRARYDIVSACPYEQIKIEQDSPDLIPLLEQINQRLSLKPSFADLPFQGGAIGYISYDLGSRLAGIDAKVQPSLSSMPLLDLGFYDWAIIVDHHLSKVTLFAANTQESTAKLVQEILFLWNGPFATSHHATLRSEFKPLISKETYCEAFAAIHQALRQGRTYQVNLTQAFHALYEGDSWAFYRKIIKKNPVPFSAFLRTQDADILSFSPERFVLYDEGQLITAPIKGTIGRSSDPLIDEQLKQELAASEKNQAENVMIVDLLRNDFGKIAQAGTVKVSALCAIESYNAVHHMVSTIEAQLKPSLRPFDAFLSCFPGGSITGAPKIESMRVINEQEPYARGVYCGAIGYFSHHGRFDTNISIRTITARKNILHLAAGGGIVIDSDPEDEYRECYIKIAAIINGLK